MSVANPKKQENEARYKAELEKHKQIEAEEQASEAAKVADTRRQELWNKAEAEMREKKEAEIKARKKREEDDFKEDVLKWAAEKAEKDLESKNQIHLKDAVGRKIAIPFSQGRTWQGMEELIHQAFLHVDVIGPEVLAGHFDLYGPEDVIILPQAWDKIIQPGWNITMKMWPMVPPAGPPPSMMPPPIGQHIGRPPMMPPPVQLPGAAPPIPMQAPPPPSGQNVSGANEEDIVVIEEDDEQRRSSAEVNDDASLGYYTSESEREIKPRRQRIAEAFSSLKSRVFRRRRRLSSSSYSSSRSEVLED
ncbi:hypothetical protein F5Y19DRAFT_488528 [Xylariaceae sp. FL1651]|nr:hypothetical protein F5Y19DRAFT_488528 [Xylariaceae sp. FL1651]